MIMLLEIVMRNLNDYNKLFFCFSHLTKNIFKVKCWRSTSRLFVEFNQPVHCSAIQSDFMQTKSKYNK